MRQLCHCFVQPIMPKSLDSSSESAGPTKWIINRNESQWNSSNKQEAETGRFNWS